jgi:FkbM family methyltransferase
MHAKPFARYLYAHVPGVAALRFQVKDLMAARFAKFEYRGVSLIPFDSPIIVDVGANRGQSIAAFKAFARRPTIVAFEPEPSPAIRLAQRYHDDKSVTIHACALASQSGNITFYAPTYGRWNCDGMAAMDREAASDWLRDPGRMYRFDERKLVVKEHAVVCRTLDSFELSPSLIKLHAQGAELSILAGARRTLDRHRPALMCAFPTPEVTAFLTGLGYQPFIYDRGCFTPGVAARPTTFTWFLTKTHIRDIQVAA